MTTIHGEGEGRVKREGIQKDTTHEEKDDHPSPTTLLPSPLHMLGWRKKQINMKKR